MKTLRNIAILTSLPLAAAWLMQPAEPAAHPAQQATQSSIKRAASAGTSRLPVSQVQAPSPAAAIALTEREAAPSLSALMALHETQPEQFVPAAVAAWPQLGTFERSQLDALDSPELMAALIRSMGNSDASQAELGELLVALEYSKSPSLPQALLSLSGALPAEQVAEVALNSAQGNDLSLAGRAAYADALRNPASSAAQRMIAAYGLAGAHQTLALTKASRLAQNKPVLGHLKNAIQLASAP